MISTIEYQKLKLIHKGKVDKRRITPQELIKIREYEKCPKIKVWDITTPPNVTNHLFLESVEVFEETVGNID